MALVSSLFCLVSCSDHCASPGSPTAGKTWTRIFAWGCHDHATSVTATADGGCIVAGYTDSPGGPEGDYDVFVLRLNAVGDSVWARTFGGYPYDYGWSICPTSDSGYVIAGSTFPWSDIYLMKIDANGDSLWTTRYENSSAYSVVATNDGGLVITGDSGSIQQRTGVLLLMKMDAFGNSVWEKTFAAAARGNSVVVAPDGGYVVAGYTSRSGFCPYIAKTTASGDSIWARTFGLSLQGAIQVSMCAAADSGFVVTGCQAGDVFLLKVDSQGDSLWTRRFARGGGKCVLPTPDRGFLVGGYTKPDAVGAGDAYIVKTDASGSEVWSRVFKNNSAGTDQEILSTALSIDGGYFLAGQAGFDRPPEYWDILVIKTDANGQF